MVDVSTYEKCRQAFMKMYGQDPQEMSLDEIQEARRNKEDDPTDVGTSMIIYEIIRRENEIKSLYNK